MSVKPIPDGYHTITPYLSIRGAASAMEFYKKAFGAEEILRMADPNGAVRHAEMQIGDSKIMLADEFPEMNFKSPQSYGGSAVMMHVYVKDVDKQIKQAVDSGAKLTREIKDQFYGDRTGAVTDPFGYVWHLATHIEDVSEAELKKRAQTATAK